MFVLEERRAAKTDYMNLYNATLNSEVAKHRIFECHVKKPSFLMLFYTACNRAEYFGLGCNIVGLAVYKMTFPVINDRVSGIIKADIVFYGCSVYCIFPFIIFDLLCMSICDN